MSPDDLCRLALVGDAPILPSGTAVAYGVKQLDREQNEYVGNLYLWDEGKFRQFTAGGKDSAPRWSPDGSQLAFLSGRDRTPQIYLIWARGYG